MIALAPVALLVAISWPFLTKLGIGDFWASVLGAVKKGKAKDLSFLKSKRVGCRHRHLHLIAPTLQ